MDAVSKDDFLALLSHELRNPVATLLAAIELHDQGEYISGRERIEYDLLIKDQVRRLARLIDDFIEVSRTESNGLSLENQVVPVTKAMEEAIRSVQVEIRRKHHTVEFLDPEKELFINADPLRLQQILRHLLTNAIMYTDDHGEIIFEGAERDGFVYISVKDNGNGIETENFDRIFDPFVRCSSLRDPLYIGMGLGLSLVKRLVGLQKGTVDVYSRGLGKGSRFTVKFPRVFTEAIAEKKFFRNTRKGLRILLAEDNFDFAEIFRRILEKEGHHVYVVNDGMEAMDYLLTEIPEVVILDIGLPGKSGYEVAAAIRQNESMKDISVIGLSGYEPNPKENAALFNHYFVKPVNREQFLTVLSG